MHSYHVGNTNERKLNSTKIGGMILIPSSMKIIVSVVKLTERHRHISMKVLHAYISMPRNVAYGGQEKYIHGFGGEI